MLVEHIQVVWYGSDSGHSSGPLNVFLDGPKKLILKQSLS